MDGPMRIGIEEALKARVKPILLLGCSSAFAVSAILSLLLDAVLPAIVQGTFCLVAGVWSRWSLEKARKSPAIVEERGIAP